MLVKDVGEKCKHIIYKQGIKLHDFLKIILQNSQS